MAPLQPRHDGQAFARRQSRTTVSDVTSSTRAFLRCSVRRRNAARGNCRAASDFCGRLTPPLVEGRTMAKSKRKPRGILVCGCSYLLGGARGVAAAALYNASPNWPAHHTADPGRGRVGLSRSGTWPSQSVEAFTMRKCALLGLVAALITIAVGAHAQEFRATISGTVTWVKRCRSSVQR